jgi:type II secretory pathway pseudopilin PulG
MIEIAICLAIIGVALVGIIGVLPYGMNTQRDNREETVIGQDAGLLMQLISSGSIGADDLTNYVYAIVNTSTNNPNAPIGYYNPLLAGQMSFSQSISFPMVPAGNWYPILTNGANIIGLLTTPELVNHNYNATNNLFNPFSLGYSNHIVACVRAISGLAADKPPQNNNIMVGDSFIYRLYVVNAAEAQDTNLLSAPNYAYGNAYGQRLNESLHDLRLTFLWPVLPSGSLGSGRQTFRTSVAGRSLHEVTNGLDVYFYQPHTFLATP